MRVRVIRRAFISVKNYRIGVSISISSSTPAIHIGWSAILNPVNKKARRNLYCIALRNGQRHHARRGNKTCRTLPCTKLKNTPAGTHKRNIPSWDDLKIPRSIFTTAASTPIQLRYNYVIRGAVAQAAPRERHVGKGIVRCVVRKRRIVAAATRIQARAIRPNCWYRRTASRRNNAGDEIHPNAGRAAKQKAPHQFRRQRVIPPHPHDGAAGRLQSRRSDLDQHRRRLMPIGCWWCEF